MISNIYTFNKTFIAIYIHMPKLYVYVYSTIYRCSKIYMFTNILRTYTIEILNLYKIL